MNFVLGSIMALIGFLMFLGALTKSNFIVYRLLVARSKILWGDNVHTFLGVSGVVIMALSSLFFFGIWGN